MPKTDLTDIVALIKDLELISKELASIINRLVSSQEAFLALILEQPLDTKALFLNVKHQGELEIRLGELAQANSLKMLDILDKLEEWNEME